MTDETPRPKSTRGQIVTAAGVGAILAFFAWTSFVDGKEGDCFRVSQQPTNYMGTALSFRWSVSKGCEILVKGRWGEDGGEWIDQSSFETVYLSDDGIE